MKGFTLIELLVVVVIISVLGAFALPYYQNAIQNARSTEAIIQWGQVKRWGSGKMFTQAQANRYEQEAAKNLKYFIPHFICREKENSELCWEAEFHLKDNTNSIQYYLTTQHNLQQLLCVPLNNRGDSYCQAFSGQEEPQDQVNGQNAYLIRH